MPPKDDLLMIGVRLAVVCQRCRNDLTHRASVDTGATVLVLPCDHCIGQAELRATREADQEMEAISKELEAAKTASRVSD